MFVMIVCFATGPPPPFCPIVTVPLYAGGVPDMAMVQSHAATRQTRVTMIALTPVEFDIGPETLVNPTVGGLSATAGDVELAVTVANRSFPVLPLNAPYACAFDPPVVVPETVNVPVPL